MARIQFDRDGDVGILTLDNPPYNLVDRELVEESNVVLAQAETAGIRGLFIRSTGDHFSAGADVNMFKGLSEREAHQLIANALAVIDRMEALPFPTVAAVRGMCLAGGLEVALAADFIWAAEDAQLGLVEAIIGAVPFGGGVQRVAARAGSARAAEIVMRGAVYDAATFERWNIINRIVPAGELESKALNFVKKLAAGPTLAHAATKRLLRAYQDQGLRNSDRIVLDLAPRLFESEDMQNGIASLLASGPGNATFAGR